MNAQSRQPGVVQTLFGYMDLFTINFLILFNGKKYSERRPLWGLVSTLVFAVCLLYAIYAFVHKEPTLINSQEIPVNKRLSVEFGGQNQLMFSLSYINEARQRVFLNNTQIKEILFLDPYIMITQPDGQTDYVDLFLSDYVVGGTTYQLISPGKIHLGEEPGDEAQLKLLIKPKSDDIENSKKWIDKLTFCFMI